MAKIPEFTNTTHNTIENSYVEQSRERGYLGMSSLGKKCSRALWYGFHFATAAKPLPRRVKRIFDRGHLEEKRIIDELVEVGGMEVFLRNPDGTTSPMTGDIGEKQEEIVGFAGHARGHPDGRVLGVIEAPKTEHLLEMKTAKESKFKEIVKHKVKKANPVYYSQMQRYMHALGLKRALLIVTNKNTEERHYERVEYVKEDAVALEQREASIIMSDLPPKKISENKNFMECKWCASKAVCHEGEMVDVNCRTCDSSDIMDDGKWHCSRHDMEIDFKKQNVGCDFWKIGWGL